MAHQNWIFRLLNSLRKQCWPAGEIHVYEDSIITTTTKYSRINVRRNVPYIKTIKLHWETNKYLSK